MKCVIDNRSGRIASCALDGTDWKTVVNTSNANGELAYLESFIYYTDVIPRTRVGYATFGIIIDIICMYCGSFGTLITTEWQRVNFELQIVWQIKVTTRSPRFFLAQCR